MKKRVLLISGNFSPELTGIGKFNGEMINWLANNNYDCSVVTTYPYYPQWKIDSNYRKNAYWFKKETSTTATPFKTLRCPHYIPSKPTGARRLISEFSILCSFAFGLFPYFFRKKYDYVLVVAPSFMLGLLGIAYKKIKGGVFINHIQDLQIDAARDFGMVKSDAIINFLFGVEKYIFHHADAVTTISAGMKNKVEEKCEKSVALFPNWVDTNLFYPLPDKGCAKQTFGFNAEDRIFLYSGAIGEKQGLNMILDAAQSFRSQNNIKFVICGAGPYKQQLEQLSAQRQLSNITFLPLQPVEKFNLLLNMADVHFILQKANAKDLLLPSKLSAILAVGGTPLVTALPGTSLYNIISNWQLGCIVEPENQKAFEDCIKYLLDNDLEQTGQKARKYAEEHLSIDAILTEFTRDILNQKPVAYPSVNSRRVSYQLSAKD